MAQKHLQPLAQPLPLGLARINLTVIGCLVLFIFLYSGGSSGFDRCTCYLSATAVSTISTVGSCMCCAPAVDVLLIIVPWLSFSVPGVVRDTARLWSYCSSHSDCMQLIREHIQRRAMVTLPCASALADQLSCAHSLHCPGSPLLHVLCAAGPRGCSSRWVHVP